jgi:hypothetical protein
LHQAEARRFGSKLSLRSSFFFFFLHEAEVQIFFSFFSSLAPCSGYEGRHQAQLEFLLFFLFFLHEAEIEFFSSFLFLLHQAKARRFGSKLSLSFSLIFFFLHEAAIEFFFSFFSSLVSS